MLIYRGRSHDRDRLADVLWLNGDAAAPRRYLRQALWKLNAALSGSRDEPPFLVATQPGRIGIRPDAELWLDVTAFDQTRRATRDLDGRRLTAQQAAELERALQLYRGELLAGWPQDWCIPERTRTQQSMLAMLDQLIGWCEVTGAHPRGLGYGQAALAVDPARESTHYALMRLHYTAGDRTAAIRQFQACGAAMAREFGVRPSARTVALYQQIREDGGDRVPAQAPVEPTEPAEPADPLAAVHARLDEIQAVLRELIEFVTRHDASEAG